MSAIAVSETPVRKSRITRPARVRHRFLAALAEGQSVGDAASHCGVSERTLRRWRKEDPVFEGAWEDAYEQSADALERVAQKRAANGSDTLLIFLLKARNPRRFRENHSVQVNGQIEHSGTVEIEDRSASLADVARVLEAVGAIAEHSGATARRSLPAPS